MSSTAYICENIRTPIGRYGGGLSGLRADDLAAAPIRHLLALLPNFDASAIDEVYWGNATQAGEDNRNIARMAALLADLPVSVPGVTVNRLCGSGLEAVGAAARAVALGDVHVAIAGGSESMSRAPFVLSKAGAAFGRDLELHDTTIGWRFVNPEMDKRHGTDSMPETAENVAEDFGVSRDDQDAFAHRSQSRAARAQTDGIFQEESMIVEYRQGKKNVVIDEDEHPRPNTSLESLASLKAPFRAGGTVTAGNASGVNDGAAAMVVASEAAVASHGFKPLARIVGMASAGVPPRLMGMGPEPATRKILERTGLSLADLDVIELNEAFASQAIAVLRELGLPEDGDFINPNGGAIALGHPLGMSGARLCLTAARELQRRGGRYGLITMCVGVGQGLAAVIERV